MLCRVNVSGLCTARGAGGPAAGTAAGTRGRIWSACADEYQVLRPSLKLRLDKLLVERGLAGSRERAQALILAGNVLVDEQKRDKAGAQVAADASIRLLGEDLKYVSRGGLKLERALEHWKIPVEGKVCFDVGASTGGFTDCLLQHGTQRRCRCMRPPSSL